MKQFRILNDFFILSFVLVSCQNSKDSLSPSLPDYTSSSAIICFQDTCSYSFVDNFLSNYDNIGIIKMLIGFDIIAFADSGTTDYWFTYLRDYEESVFSISIFKKGSNDFEISVRFTGEKFLESIIEHFSNIPHFNIQDIEFYEKQVWFSAQSETMIYWVEHFETFDFLVRVSLLDGN